MAYKDKDKMREYNRKYYKDNIDKERARGQRRRKEKADQIRGYRAANKERAQEHRENNRDAYRAYATEYRAKNKADPAYRSRHRAAQLKHKYGISVSDYDAALIAQCGRCGICSDASPKLVVDHCHATENFRGLICWSCNIGLGHFKDDPSRLAAAINYLKEGFNE